jgi:chromosome partitioning protein
MKIITIASLKGGVGKTTLAIFLGLTLSKLKKKVLLIDADPNNNLTDFFLRDEDTGTLEAKNIYSVLTGRSPVQDCIRSHEYGINILPATPDLAKSQIELVQDPSAMIRFSKGIKSLNYDYVIYDTPPSLTYELYLAIHEANVVLCPVAFSRWTFQGFDLLRYVCQRREQSSPIAVPSMVSAKDLERIQASGMENISKSFITKSSALSQAATLGKQLPDKSEIWDQFKALAKEVIK